MTQDEQEAFDLINMFNRLNSRVWKDCTECGHETYSPPEDELCLECQYNQEHPDESDMYWMWSKEGRPTWGIVAHWPAGEPLPNAGEQVTVHRKDGSTSIVKIKQVTVHRKDSSTLIPKIQGVNELRYLSNGRAQLRCMIERDGQKPNQSGRGKEMPETTIRECSTPDCTNTWEVEAEDDQRKICGLCEIEEVDQTPIPTAESEGFDKIERHLSMAMKVGLRKMAKDDLQHRGPGFKA